MSQATDEAALCRRWQDERDVAARDRLLAVYAPVVPRLAERLGLEGADRDDVMQEGWVALLTALARFDPDFGVPLAGYVPYCVRGRMLTAVEAITARRSALELAEDGRALLDPTPPPDEQLAIAAQTKERRALLTTALDSLGWRARAIVERRHLDDAPAGEEELARALGSDVARLRALETRALGTLFALLAPNGGGAVLFAGRRFLLHGMDDGRPARRPERTKAHETAGHGDVVGRMRRGRGTGRPARHAGLERGAGVSRSLVAARWSDAALPSPRVRVRAAQEPDPAVP